MSKCGPRPSVGKGGHGIIKAWEKCVAQEKAQRDYDEKARRNTRRTSNPMISSGYSLNTMPNFITPQQSLSTPSPMSGMGFDPNAAMMMPDYTRRDVQFARRMAGASANRPVGLAPAGVPSYAEGGMIGPGGMPEPMPSAGLGAPAATETPVSPQMMDAELNRFQMQHPDKMGELQSAIQQAVSSGQISPTELNMIAQLASVAAQNPEMYPYVRRVAIQQGLASDADLPQEFDSGLIFALLTVARAVQGGQSMLSMGQGMPQMGQNAIPSMARGGEVAQSAKADGSVLINAHEGEYVVPANVVKMKGKEFFDSLVEKYKNPK